MAEKRSGSSEMQVVVFNLADEACALPVNTVREILTWQPVTHVPNAQDHVMGITNIRGNVTAVVSLRSRFGLPPAERDDDTRIMVVEHDDHVAGIIVDGVREVLRVEESQMEEPSEVVGNGESVRAIIKTEEDLILLLDVEALFEGQVTRTAQLAAAD